jgi:hypothetical protein
VHGTVPARSDRDLRGLRWAVPLIWRWHHQQSQPNLWRLAYAAWLLDPFCPALLCPACSHQAMQYNCNCFSCVQQPYCSHSQGQGLPLGRPWEAYPNGTTYKKALITSEGSSQMVPTCTCTCTCRRAKPAATQLRQGA